jgi:putative transcriptional regulator
MMSTIRRTLDPNTPRGLSPEAHARLDGLRGQEIEDKAKADPDNPPLTDEELSRGVLGRKVRRARERLGLSQRDFATRYAINLRRLQDWEQGRFAPDSAMLAYLKVIEREPEMVRRILEVG